MPEEQPSESERELSPELVKKVSDKVYALMLADLKRQRERGLRKSPRTWKR